VDNPYEPTRHCKTGSVDQERVAYRSFCIALGGMLLVSTLAMIDAYIVSRATGTAILCFILCFAAKVPLLFPILILKNETRLRQLVVRISTVVVHVFSVSCYLLYLLKSDVPNLRNSSQLHIFVFPMVLFVLSTCVAIVSCTLSFLLEQTRLEEGKGGKP
jgi:hypothetical protein